METDKENEYGIVYKDEVEELAKKLKCVIYDMERLGDRYYIGRPTDIQDSIRYARDSHKKLMVLRDHTVRR